MYMKFWIWLNEKLGNDCALFVILNEVADGIDINRLRRYTALEFGTPITQG